MVRDDRWLEVEDDFTNAVEHFKNAVTLFHRGGFEEPNIEGYAAGIIDPIA